jgi:hypothetical protein
MLPSDPKDIVDYDLPRYNMRIRQPVIELPDRFEKQVSEVRCSVCMYVYEWVWCLRCVVNISMRVSDTETIINAHPFTHSSTHSCSGVSRRPAEDTGAAKASHRCRFKRQTSRAAYAWVSTTGSHSYALLHHSRCMPLRAQVSPCVSLFVHV